MALRPGFGARIVASTTIERARKAFDDLLHDTRAISLIASCDDRIAGGVYGARRQQHVFVEALGRTIADCRR
jgi:hypothetical protein